jgi:hypothetical protein
MKAIARNGVTKLLEDLESEQSRDLGYKPTDLETLTFCVTEIPPQDEPRFVLILQSRKPFDKAATLQLGPKAKPDARGFYTAAPDQLLHYPDDNTAVLLHRELAQKYLDGFARDRAAWPLNTEMLRTAEKHTLFAFLDVDKLPLRELRDSDLAELGALTTARTATITGDLTGQELRVAGRAAFPDAATAGRARDTIAKFVGLIAGEVAAYTQDLSRNSRDMLALDAFKPVLAEAQRAVKEAKIEVSGSDVTLAANYAANFDIDRMVAEAKKQSREAAPRIAAENNFKQCILGMHSYRDNNRDQFAIHGIGPKGVPLKDWSEKPLLSWRVALLPYVEEGNLYRQFKLDEPWDSEHNLKLIEKMPRLFAPVAAVGQEEKRVKPGYTHVQMVVGPAALQPGLSLRRIPDGTGNTIALVEAAEPVIWTKPDDIILPGQELPRDFRGKFGGLFPGGFHAALCDGSVRFIPDSMSDRTLALALHPSDGQAMPAEWAPQGPIRK